MTDIIPTRDKDEDASGWEFTVDADGFPEGCVDIIMKLRPP